MTFSRCSLLGACRVLFLVVAFVLSADRPRVAFAQTTPTSLPRPAAATAFTFVPLNVIGAAYGINDEDQIVGDFGLLDEEGLVTRLDVPGSRPGSTRARAINDRSDIVGAFAQPPRGYLQGFLLSGGLYTQFTFEQFVELLGINNSGYMVGRSCCRRGGNPEGFVIPPGGGVQVIDVPNSRWNWASGINSSGQIVGTFLPSPGPFTATTLDALLSVDGAYNPTGETIGTSMNAITASLNFTGYVYSRGVFTTFSVPGAGRTDANGINDAGQIVGHYRDAAYPWASHGFLRDTNGTLTSLDFPGATDTSAKGISEDGKIVGSYTDAVGATHAFMATRCELDHGASRRRECN